MCAFDIFIIYNVQKRAFDLKITSKSESSVTEQQSSCGSHARLPRVVILAAHINSFVHVAVGRAVLTRPLHDAVRTGTVTKPSERLSHEPLEPQSHIHAHVLLREHPPKKENTPRATE